MLGRLHSDIRFREKNLAKNLNHYLIEKAFQIKEISWVGANTQKNNLPAKRVLEKLGLSKLTTIHGAVAEDLTSLVANGKSCNEITNLDKKKI